MARLIKQEVYRLVKDKPAVFLKDSSGISAIIKITVYGSFS